MVEAHAPVLAALKRPVGHGADLLASDRRLVLDDHLVEVPVGRVARRAQDPAVLPALDHVAHGSVRGVAPGARGSGISAVPGFDNGRDQSRSPLRRS